MSEALSAVVARRRKPVRTLTLAMLAVFLAGEVGVRLLETSRGPTGSLYDYVVPMGSRFKMRPGVDVLVPERYGDIHYHFNSAGYRDDDLQPRSEGRRIALLGDSVSFGLGVDQDAIYPALLERRLRADVDPDYDVLNLAIFSYNTVNELDALLTDGLADRPQVIVLQFYMNDFSSAARTPHPVQDAANRIAALKNQLVYKSALYRRIHQAVTGLTFSLFHDLRRNRFPGTLNDAEPQDKRAYLAATPDEAIEAFQALRSFQRAARERHARFLLVVSPDEVQLFSDRFDDINRRIAAFCRREGIDELDPLPFLRAAPDRARLYNDGVHLSRTGHRRLATLLFVELARRGMVGSAHAQR
jgi:lysophospholipase L1-like esterase